MKNGVKFPKSTRKTLYDNADSPIPNKYKKVL